VGNTRRKLGIRISPPGIRISPQRSDRCVRSFLLWHAGAEADRLSDLQHQKGETSRATDNRRRLRSAQTAAVNSVQAGKLGLCPLCAKSGHSAERPIRAEADVWPRARTECLARPSARYIRAPVGSNPARPPGCLPSFASGAIQYKSSARRSNPN
jgi:hypothetical protein